MVILLDGVGLVEPSWKKRKDKVSTHPTHLHDFTYVKAIFSGILCCTIQYMSTMETDRETPATATP
jgi:hypothetical protein